MDKNQKLSDQRRKIEEVRLWLEYRIGSEGSPKVRDYMFECWRLLSLASVSIETVNFLTNDEYNDNESYRSRTSKQPPTPQGFGGI